MITGCALLLVAVAIGGLAWALRPVKSAAEPRHPARRARRYLADEGVAAVVCARRRLGFAPRAATATRLTHPAFTPGSGLPVDGRPLDDYELRILGRIAGDSIVDITFEPDYREPR